MKANKSVERRGLLLAVLLICWPLTAAGQISVDKSIIHFTPRDRPFQNVVVNNTSNQVVGVTSEPTEVLRSGFKDEERVDSDQFLVSPKRFTVEPNGQRTIRLLITESPSDQQKVYRVRLFPHSGEPVHQIVKKQGDRQAIVKVLTGTGILIFMDPLEIKTKLVYERKGGRIIFKNEGNVYVMLHDGQVCDAPDKNCKELPGNRLYAGNTWELRVPQGKYVRYQKESGGKNEELVIN